MPAVHRELHPDVVRRVIAAASGPHPCPECDGPTWTTPPVPWPDLREYVTECSSCRRPLQVHVDAELVLRGGARAATAGTPALDLVTRVLDSPGLRAFARRTALAAIAPVVLLVLGWSSAGAVAGLVCAALAVVPSAVWAPALLAGAVAEAGRRLPGAEAAPRRAVEVTRARWAELERERFEHCRELLEAS